MAVTDVLVHVNMNGNEIQNVLAQKLSSAPSSPSAGQFYYNTTDNLLYVYNGSSWLNAMSQGKTYTEGTGININNTTISADFGDMTASNVTTALGYTPYNSTNPSGYQANVIETIKVNNTALTPSSKAVNITVPVNASDVSALPSSTKYGATLTASLDTTNYKLTITLKDQDGNTLGTAQVVDFPIESVVVSGSYDNTNKKIVLTLQSGSTIDVPVGDLVSGLQTEITSSSKLSADLVSNGSTNKVVTQTEKNTWNGKQNAISDLTTIRSGASAGATATQKYSVNNTALTASSGVCTWTVTHNLGSDVQIAVYDATSLKEIVCEKTKTSSTVATIKLNSTSNIAANKYTAVVIGK